MGEEAVRGGGRMEEVAVSEDRLEQLTGSMQVLHAAMETMREHCGRESAALLAELLQLQAEQRELAQRYAALVADMRNDAQAMEQLQLTKQAFEAKERQTQKLNRQL